MKEFLIKDNNFFVTEGWMTNRLNLKGNSRNVFAIIYGFSQDGYTWYEGSQDYLAEWCNATTQGISKNLKELVEKDLIIKQNVKRGRGHFCRYKCNLQKINELRCEKVIQETKTIRYY